MLKKVVEYFTDSTGKTKKVYHNDKFSRPYIKHVKNQLKDSRGEMENPFKDKIYNVNTDRFLQKNKVINKNGTLKSYYKKLNYEINSFGNIIKDKVYITCLVSGYLINTYKDEEEDKIILQSSDVFTDTPIDKFDRYEGCRYFDYKDYRYINSTNFYLLSGVISRTKYEKLKESDPYVIKYQSPESETAEIFKDWEEEVSPFLKSMFGKFDGFEDFFNYFDFVGTGGYIDIIRFEKIKIVPSIEQYKGVFSFEWEKAKAFRNVSEQNYNFSYTSYHTINKDGNIEIYKEDSKLPTIENACILNHLINIYKEPIEKRYKFIVNHQNLWEIMRPNEPFDKKNLGLTLNDMKKFLRKFKLCCYCYNIQKDLIFKYHCEDEGIKKNKHINPITTYWLFHNKHLEPLNFNLDSLEKKRDFIKNNYIPNEPSTNYPIKKKNKNKFDIDIICHNYKEILEVIHNNNDKKIKISYNTYNLIDLYKKFKKHLKYECSIEKGTGGLYSKLILLNINGNHVFISKLIDDDSYITIEKNEYENFQLFRNKINAKFFTKNNCSSYNEFVKDLIKNNLRGGLVGKLKQPKDKYIQIDFNKFYCSILLNMPNIPQINNFDNFIKYNNEPIEDMNLYYVEKLKNDFSYPTRKFNICYGKNIKNLETETIKIISVLTPSNLYPNTIKETIKELYDTNLNVKIKKWLVNCTIGLFGKKYNKISKCYYSNDIEEILELKRKHGGTIDDITDKDDNESHYIHYVSKRKELDNGFLLLQSYIYDTAERILFDMMNTIKDSGGTIYAIQTDAIYIEPNLDVLKKIRDNGLLETIDKNSFDSIGKVKIETQNLCLPEKPIKIEKNSNEWLERDFTPTILEINDEWNIEELSDLLKKYKNVNCQADTPGCGKSYMNKKTFPNALYVVPYNSQCQNLEIEGLNAMTTNNMFNTLINNEEKEIKKNHNINEQEAIIYDEINLNDPYTLERIMKQINDYPDKNIHCTGDMYQNLPVSQPVNNVKDYKKYIEDCINQIFKYKIVLKKNKRCKTEEGRKKIEEVSKYLKEETNKNKVIKYLYEKFPIIKNFEDLPKYNQCFYNSYKNEMNKIKHGDKELLYEGLELVSLETETIKFNKEKIKIYVNKKYIVKKLCNDYIILNDFVNEDFKFPISLWDKYFSYSYFRTGHSYQGLDIPEKFAIHNIKSKHVSISWIRTTITRCIDIDDVYIYDDNYKAEIKTNIIVDRINQHIRNDILNKRVMTNYIDVEYIENMLDNTYCCKYCSKDIDYQNFSIDRINNDLGHIKNNIQIICKMCNITKH